MTNQTEILELLEKSFKGSLTQGEEKRLDYLLRESVANGVPFKDESERQEIEDHLLEKIHSSKNRKKIRNIARYIVAAAASVIVFSVGVYKYFNYCAPEEITQQLATYNTDETNEKQVTLTLSDGTKVNLNQDKTGVLSEESVEIVGSEGLLAYTSNSSDTLLKSKLVYNTLKTPSGVQYHLMLSDGTKIWLNGNSEIKYPVAFRAGERSVELSGEAYFEVAKSQKPFKVYAKTTTVQVLGTHFNVMAYKDDAEIKTTLLEGSVKVKSLTKEQILRPGQQAISSESDLTVYNTDAELVVGWRKGLFTFNNEPLEQVMKQISRWYNMDVVYSKSRTKVLFTGIIPVRDDVKKALLPVEEAANIKFDVKDGKIIITENNN
ncbi:anti-FecI sigma factor, FecR [Pseudopedobacter saltans DSM 12145]|uniref:Anti-FecI sigma factor, FecR n=1 Tax=Pseudopedobacter saltans (strain ATCC 51119 / DSM 12145 / JCM 21818 / CCUG 39354 / LMG 10337 / NBRC 100064 / NCIMB 13643) TaxID=762903 RepID=F0SB84_PSESL|nr:FecR family protein [Pseudopedobacter saltans]ADY53711.1 anti-FecI sigma factor, FecR [Pseudopedobacter saltans DSM 12145]